MTKERDIRWKLDRLKEAISKSGNVKNEIKDMLEKVTIDNIGAEVSRISRDEFFSLYQFRYRYLESIGKYNESFANLLISLEEIDSSLHLVINVLRTEDKSYLLFTDKDYIECFGIIY